MARVEELWSLSYAHEMAGARHVRAGSGMARLGNEIGIVQDDSLAIAWLNPQTRNLRRQNFPDVHGPLNFDDIQGNKAQKPDFEAAFSLTLLGVEHFFALGSGSSNMRFRAAQVTGPQKTIRVLDVTRWLAPLAADVQFCGPKLNLEAACVLGDKLWLFQRGNGGVIDGLKPVNAIAEFLLADVMAYLADPIAGDVPKAVDFLQVDLGSYSGANWGFADAAVHGGQVCFLLSAEASPDALSDGEVHASGLGCFNACAQLASVQLIQSGLIVDPVGQVFQRKLEGLASLDGQTLLAVSDDDNPNQPSICAKLALAKPQSTA